MNLLADDRFFYVTKNIIKGKAKIHFDWKHSPAESFLLFSSSASSMTLWWHFLLFFHSERQCDFHTTLDISPVCFHPPSIPQTNWPEKKAWCFNFWLALLIVDVNWQHNFPVRASANHSELLIWKENKLIENRVLDRKCVQHWKVTSFLLV